MGKHTEHLNKLREWKHFKESNYQSTMAMFSSQMDDTYRRFNEQTHANSMYRLDRQIREAEKLAQQEQIDEITQGVLKKLSKEGGKTAKQMADELSKALKSIKL